MCKWGRSNFKGAQALWYEFSHYTKLLFKTLQVSLAPVLIWTTTKSAWNFGLRMKIQTSAKEILIMEQTLSVMKDPIFCLGSNKYVAAKDSWLSLPIC